MSEPAASAVEPDSPWIAVGRLGAFLAVALVAVLATHFTSLGSYITVKGITDFSERLGAWGPVVLIVAGVLSPLLFIPRWPIAFVAGLLYGIAWGTAIATFGSSFGALLHYYFSRKLVGPMSDRLRRNVKFIPRKIAKDKQFLAVFLLRAFPLSSFVATNIMAGALRLHSGRFYFASLLGMIPSSLMYAAWGKLMKKPAPEYYAVAVFSLMLIIVGTLYGRRMFTACEVKEAKPQPL
jgi:uncharacterized membrane protein YdjX (TVP38/TMEM64 family)